MPHLDRLDRYVVCGAVAGATAATAEQLARVPLKCALPVGAFAPMLLYAAVLRGCHLGLFGQFQFGNPFYDRVDAVGFAATALASGAGLCVATPIAHPIEQLGLKCAASGTSVTAMARALHSGGRITDLCRGIPAAMRKSWRVGLCLAACDRTALSFDQQQQTLSGR